ncbi:MAG: hypothetical protein GY729_08535 [Desulfobacteraceae bacterium]|nr:hypothetical protein [Desulfobacteraceae bacterium]
MLKLSIAHFIVVSIGYPLINAYLFFIVYGILLKHKPLGLAIEGFGFYPKGAFLAAVIGTLFCLILSIPCALVQIFLILKIQSPIWIRYILWLSCIALGLSLGIGISINHFKNYFLALPLQGFFSGFLLAMLLFIIWKGKIGSL